MNGKRFPMFKSWQILFGKDRAMGEIVEDPQEIPDKDDHVANHNLNDIETGYIPRYENGEPSFIPS